MADTQAPTPERKEVTQGNYIAELVKTKWCCLRCRQRDTWWDCRDQDNDIITCHSCGYTMVTYGGLPDATPKRRPIRR